MTFAAFVPLGLVDASDLRKTLDTLHEALSRPTFSPQVLPELLAYDRARTLSGLKQILGALDGVDLNARRALSAMKPATGDPETRAELRALVDALPSAFARHVAERLGQRKAEIIQTWLETPGFDLLGVFRRGHDENAHSDVLRFLLDPRSAPAIAPHALRRLLSRVDASSETLADLEGALAQDLLTVRREVVLGRTTGDAENLMRLDLVVFAPNLTIAIENKVHAAEHGHQTSAYQAWLEAQRGFGVGIFLTPEGRPAQAPEFRPFSYVDLLDCLFEAVAADEPLTPGGHAALHAYLHTLEQHVLSTELRSLTRVEGPS